ncbi:uncharacterized protein LOC8276850 isoform X3 [Ricinus communis]|uniref:uncharacterized protein LOC8276850 isoform X3 n=1 Tax=Ricinus communis TaxID=3988 RepID=UPI0007723F94|nr:uncharacterized protein LOC8276850 isoform X3 [Ricinus communis]|eukprot:XP_015572667.1 uncharacterized protein LOC8276850 [Ricinus communis]
MIVCIKGEEDENDVTPPRKVSNTGNTLAEVLVPKGSPNSIDMVKHVVIVMDALKGFSRGPLQWALDHVIQTRCTITLLGVMPWIPLPLSCKTWLDVWTFDQEDLSALKGRSDLKNDHKYQKIRRIIELCEQKGVVPCMKVAMGHPLKLVVLEQTTNLHATFVVLDRHLRKNKAFFAQRLPSSVVMMKSGGDVDMLKIRSSIDSSELTPGKSPENMISTPQVILSEALSELLK